MSHEDLILLVKAGFTAEEIRGFGSDKQILEPLAEIPPQTDTITEQIAHPTQNVYNGDINAEIMRALENINKTLHANALLNTTIPTPQSESVDDVLAQIINPQPKK